jgi:hypothetical protein
MGPIAKRMGGSRDAVSDDQQRSGTTLSQRVQAEVTGAPAVALPVAGVTARAPVSCRHEHPAVAEVAPAWRGMRAPLGPSASSLSANDRVTAGVRDADEWLLLCRPSGTLDEAAALRTIQQRQTAKDARPVRKGAQQPARRSTCSSPEAGRWLGQVRSWSEWLHGSWGEGDRRLARCSGRSPSRTSFRGEKGQEVALGLAAALDSRLRRDRSAAGQHEWSARRYMEENAEMGDEHLRSEIRDEQERIISAVRSARDHWEMAKAKDSSPTCSNGWLTSYGWVRRMIVAAFWPQHRHSGGQRRSTSTVTSPRLAAQPTAPNPVKGPSRGTGC